MQVLSDGTAYYLSLPAPQEKIDSFYNSEVKLTQVDGVHQINWVSGGYIYKGENNENMYDASDIENDIIVTNPITCQKLPIYSKINVGNLTTSLINHYYNNNNQEIVPPTNQLCNFPRLFVICSDGSGYELLQERVVAKWLKMNYEDDKIVEEEISIGNCEILEEVVDGDDGSISVSVLSSVEDKFGSEDKNHIIYRQVKINFASV